MSEHNDRRAATPEIVRLRQLVALAPSDPDLYLALAEQLLQRGLRDEAVLAIRTVIDLVPNHLEARKLLARVWARGSNSK